MTEVITLTLLIITVLSWVAASALHIKAIRLHEKAIRAWDKVGR